MKLYTDLYSFLCFRRSHLSTVGIQPIQHACNANVRPGILYSDMPSINPISFRPSVYQPDSLSTINALNAMLHHPPPQTPTMHSPPLPFVPPLLISIYNHISLCIQDSQACHALPPLSSPPRPSRSRLATQLSMILPTSLNATGFVMKRSIPTLNASD